MLCKNVYYCNHINQHRLKHDLVTILEDNVNEDRVKRKEKTNIKYKRKEI